MAGRTPNRNTRRATGSSRRTVGGSSSSSRRTSAARRRTSRRRSPSMLTGPGFWLIVCIAVIILILIFRGCGSEDMTDGETVSATVGSTESHVILGNTEPQTEPEDEEPGGSTGSDTSNNTGNNTGSSSGNDTGDDGEKPSQDAGEQSGSQSGGQSGTDEENGENKTYGTFRVNPGIYLIGEKDGMVAAGNVKIEVLSGAGTLYTSDGQLNLSSVGAGTNPISGVVLKSGEYLTVTGDLSIKATYVSEQSRASLSAPAVTTESESRELGAPGMNNDYMVLSEGGDLKPGIYQIAVFDGVGTVTVPDRDRGITVSFTLGKTEGYNSAVEYVILNDGDRVTVNGCVAEFTEMKEG